MSINRYNYQEYFLLYTDNELPAANRKLVEDFVALHPDLAVELEMLSQTIMMPEQDVTFENKELLFQFDGTENVIHPGNFEEFAIGYSDNELTETDRNHLEKFLLHNPDFRKDFDLINSIKLEADVSVVFPDKQLLYRQEKETKRIILPWWRVAAAAVVLLFAGTLWYNQRPDSAISPKLAQEKNGVSAQDAGKSTIVKSATPAPVNLNVKPARISADVITHSPQLVVRKTKNTVTGNEKRLPARQAQESNASQYNNTIAQHALTRSSDKNEKTAENKIPSSTELASSLPGSKSRIDKGAVATLDAAIGDGDKALQDPLDVKINRPGAGTSSLATTVAITYDEENGAIDNLTERKSPLREIIRKASRFIDKNTVSRTSKKSGLLIGNIQIAFQ